MVIFHSCVALPEGIKHELPPGAAVKSHCEAMAHEEFDDLPIEN